MITVRINEPKFEYDIHSLVKAFYPGEDVTVSMDVEAPDYEVCFAGDSFSFGHAGETPVSAPVPEGADRAAEKNIIKALIYGNLSGKFGALPWGNLTGIRPTKIPMKLLNEGKTPEEILAYMKEAYSVSDEKGRLAIDIAARELELLKPIDFENGYSLYIGIAFCPTTCLYCSFTSNPIAKWRNRVGEYIGAIEKELKYVYESRGGQNPDTIYIGGGTPTSLDAADLETLLSAVDRYFDVKALHEFTVEAGRADSITIEKLKVLKAHGVTRISVNPQTMNDRTLEIIGRRHSVDDVIRAFNDARSLGFDNINMDIILGLPGEGEAEVKHTIDEIVKLKPDSLTVHSLAIKRGSRLHERMEEYGVESIMNTDATMAIASEGAAVMDLKPYYLYRQKNMAGNFENTGFARDGAPGIYNILIMEEVQTIIACGAGTVTKRVYGDGRIERCDNVKDVMMYIENIDEMIDRKRKLFED